MKSIHGRFSTWLYYRRDHNSYIQTYFEEEHNEKYNDRSLFDSVNAKSRSEIRSQREIHIRNAKRSQLRNVRSVTIVPWDLFETTRRLDCASQGEKQAFGRASVKTKTIAPTFELVIVMVKTTDWFLTLMILSKLLITVCNTQFVSYYFWLPWQSCSCLSKLFEMLVKGNYIKI